MGRVMGIVSVVVSGFLLSSCASGQSTKAETAKELSTRDITSNSTAAIVRVETSSPLGDGVGTGFFVHESGVLATNLHVIHGAADVVVRLHDGTEHAVVSVEAVDHSRDLALIRIDAKGKMFPTLKLGDSRSIKAGDPIVAIGNPLGVLNHTVSDGLVSAVRLISEDFSLLQVSAPISRGSSGGPLFNNAGDVIGVATAVSIQGQNLNFGVPSEYVARLVENPQPTALAGFVRSFGKQEHVINTKKVGQVKRQIPLHDKSLLASCPAETVSAARKEIAKAIDDGAPLYNSGDHEACYKAYEKSAIVLEEKLGCKGIQKALGMGLLTAGSKPNYTEKAWAMRDAFDGLMYVMRKSEAKKNSSASIWPMGKK